MRHLLPLSLLRVEAGAKLTRLDFGMDSAMTTMDWRPAAAYLYVLRLDEVALAWEYVRRNPRYRRDWEEFGQRHPAYAARNWRLRCFGESLPRFPRDHTALAAKPALNRNTD